MLHLVTAFNTIGVNSSFIHSGTPFNVEQFLPKPLQHHEISVKSDIRNLSTPENTYDLSEQLGYAV